jgi:hypothetical protein
MDDSDESGQRAGWRYSGNVTSPEVLRSLGQTACNEAEDLAPGQMALLDVSEAGAAENASGPSYGSQMCQFLR